jgi:hypothetical protein
MCWVWVLFSTKLYCAIHFTSHYQFPHDNIFSSTGKHYRACQCEVTGASSRLCRKDSSLKSSWIFSGATLLWIENQKASAWITNCHQQVKPKTLKLRTWQSAAWPQPPHPRRCSDMWALKMVDSWTDRENWRDLEKKICFSAHSYTMNPTQNDARFNCSYTVRGQHVTTWHQDSTIFIWNVHSNTVWTLHWYCIVHWY